MLLLLVTVPMPMTAMTLVDGLVMVLMVILLGLGLLLMVGYMCCCILCWLDVLVEDVLPLLQAQLVVLLSLHRTRWHYL